MFALLISDVVWHRPVRQQSRHARCLRVCHWQQQRTCQHQQRQTTLYSTSCMTITFPNWQSPNTQMFWSLTMYNAKLQCMQWFYHDWFDKSSLFYYAKSIKLCFMSLYLCYSSRHNLILRMALRWTFIRVHLLKKTSKKIFFLKMYL